MNITVLYGTESGNSEMTAEDLGAALREPHEQVEQVTVIDLQDFNPTDFNTDTLYFVVCSTHGEGNLPNSALPFAEAFDAALPDMTGVRYAMFGLGDTFYDSTYSQGSENLDRRFAAQGAVRIGDYGRHDASGWDLASDVALAWYPGVLAAAHTAV